MNNSIFLPRRIRVGFQKREDTYTKKLAYVIYYDEKGKLRKEASWESWRSKEIKPVEYDNEPTEGFVLNKKVGGYAGDWGDFRQAYVRVYDPRGFEFEITIPNLLYILEHTSSIKGKGLEDQFVYGWDGTDLVLLPTCSPDYAALTALNIKRFENETVKAKDLKIGATYLTKQNKRCIYMGKFDYYSYGYFFDGKFFSSYTRMTKYAEKNNLTVRSERPFTDRWGARQFDNRYTTGRGTDEKHFFFYFPDEKNYYGNVEPKFDTYHSISGLLIDTLSDQPAENYSELFDTLEHLEIYSPIDESRDKRMDYTFEEFSEELKKHPYRVVVLSSVGKIQIWNEDRDNPTEKYYVSLESSGVDKIGKFFALDPDDRYGKIIPVTAKEIFEKIHPQYIAQYLKNGKFYRRYIP